jgi:hypothetical protein
MAKKNASKKGVDPSRLLWVSIYEAKPNPMFTEWQRSTIRFLTFNRAVKCAACGKKKRGMWTMLCDFKAVDMESSFGVAKNYPQTFAPLTPVCSDHPIGPDLDGESDKPAKEMAGVS